MSLSAQSGIRPALPRAASAASILRPKYDVQALLRLLLEREQGLLPEEKIMWVRTNDERLMDWIQDKVRPAVLAGFELETCYQRLKVAVIHLPRLKPLPLQKPPRVPAFLHLQRPEANLDFSAATFIAVDPAPKPLPPKKVVEVAVNKFLETADEKPRFSFHSKQRFSDLQELVSRYHGKPLTEAVIRMPEKESEETYIPPEPAFAGIPLKAFENEGFIFQRLAPATAASTQRPLFLSKFFTPDLKTMKADIARNQSSEGPDPYKPVSDHKFRDQDRPADYGKPEFRLRVQADLPPPLLLHTESSLQVLERKKQAGRRQEEQEKMRRTEIGGKTRSEWAWSKHTNPKELQFASGDPHPLLPKEEYVDPFHVMARSYNF